MQRPRPLQASRMKMTFSLLLWILTTSLVLSIHSDDSSLFGGDESLFSSPRNYNHYIRRRQQDQEQEQLRNLQLPFPPFFPPSEELQLRFNDNQCLTFLRDSDTNGDGGIDYGEFRDFVQDLGFRRNDNNNNGGGGEEQERLPLELEIVFNVAACLCMELQQDETNESCCIGENAEIDINRSETDGMYLRIICVSSQIGVMQAQSSTNAPSATTPPPVPTVAPTAGPSMGPTMAPVAAGSPTSFPSTTGEPTSSAPSGQTPTTSSQPSDPPTMAPTNTPFGVVEYDIAVTPTATNVDDNLEDAMGVLVTEFTLQQAGRRQRDRRHLQQDPATTQILSREDTTCPVEVMDPDLTCQAVVHDVPLLQEEANMLQEAIEGGILQNILGNESGIIILSEEYLQRLRQEQQASSSTESPMPAGTPDDDTPDDDDDDDGGGLSSAAIVGIIVALAAVVLICFVLVPWYKRQQPNPEVDKPADYDERVVYYDPGDLEPKSTYPEYDDDDKRDDKEEEEEEEEVYHDDSDDHEHDDSDDEEMMLLDTTPLPPPVPPQIRRPIGDPIDPPPEFSSSCSEYYSSSDEGFYTSDEGSRGEEDLPQVPSSVGRDGFVIRTIGPSSRSRRRMPSSIVTMSGVAPLQQQQEILPKKPLDFASLKTEETAVPSAGSSTTPTTTTGGTSELTSQALTSQAVAIGLAAAAGVAASPIWNQGGDSDYDGRSGTSLSVEPSVSSSTTPYQATRTPSNQSLTETSLLKQAPPPVASVYAGRRMQPTPDDSLAREGDAGGMTPVSSIYSGDGRGTQEPRGGGGGATARIEEEADAGLPASLPLYEEILAADVLKQEVLETGGTSKTSKEAGEEWAIAQTLGAVQQKEEERLLAPSAGGEERAVAETLSAVQGKTEEADEQLAATVARQKEVLGTSRTGKTTSEEGEERAVAETLSAVQRKTEGDE